MDRSRRIQALGVLQRIKEHELDAHAAQMGQIRLHQAKLQDEVTRLNEQVETEAQITSPESAPFLAGFLQAVETRKAFLQSEITTLDKKAALIEGQLFDTYTEVRSNKAVLDKTLLDKRKEEDMAEASALEEIARNRYLRQKAKA